MFCNKRQRKAFICGKKYDNLCDFTIFMLAISIILQTATNILIINLSFYEFHAGCRAEKEEGVRQSVTSFKGASSVCDWKEITSE